MADRRATAQDVATVARMVAAAELLEERIATCHERRACGRCRASIGERCKHILTGRELKHSHAERWGVPKR